MKALDKNYLRLQFRDKIYSKDGTEFQSFFENIMEEAFPDFRRIRPYGNKGDGGNDGFRKNSGIYYQVYAPQVPKIKELEAANKLKSDFEKLKKQWDGISTIKEYFFVFNDKYCGSTQALEEATTQLKRNNSAIKFDLFLSRNLENEFFKLEESDFLNLGFNIDSRNTVLLIHDYFEKIKIELDRNNCEIAIRLLENIKDTITNLNEEHLSIEYDLLEARCYQKIEKVDFAIQLYENISKKYLNDPRALLNLAENYLNINDFIKNKEFLDQAEKIDKEHWLLKLETLIRKRCLGGKINVESIDFSAFPDNKRIQSNLYRLCSIFYLDTKDITNAARLIKKATKLNPNSLSNYIGRLSLIQTQMIISEDANLRLEFSQELLSEIDSIEKKFQGFGDIGPRYKAILNIIKINALHAQESFHGFGPILEETFNQALSCCFDNEIDKILTDLLMIFSLREDKFQALLQYINNSQNKYSDELAKILIVQFNDTNSLFKIGKDFFSATNKDIGINFINDLESKNFKSILNLIKGDLRFAINILQSFKNFPDLRKKIIENLPDDGSISKDKLSIMVNIDEGKIDEAFEIIKKLDLMEFNYFECRQILEIARKKKAWDYEVAILEKLLTKEDDDKIIFNLKIQLFQALFNLKKYPEAIQIGEELLGHNQAESFLNENNRKALLINTVLACLERGKIDNIYTKKSLEIIEKHQLKNPSFEFKAGIEAEVYLENNDYTKALESAITGIKIKKILTSEEYVKLYFLFTLKIANQINLTLDSLEKIEENTFVKFSNKEQWYFVGSGNELDTIKISDENEIYSLIIDQGVGSKIVFSDKYSSVAREEVVECIYKIDKYVLWKAIQNFNILSQENILIGIQRIELPENDGQIDTKYLLNFLKDQRKEIEPIFDKYCENNLPLAMLAVSEGNLVNAIARIQNERRGYINFSTGAIAEFDIQKDIAKSVIEQKLPFYIDGTSALILSEFGILKKISTFLPNIKVPQSVINLLIEISEKFRDAPGRSGFMGFARGELVISSIDKDKEKHLHSNFLEGIKTLEQQPSNISVLSLASKIDCFSEQKVHEELCDACILAQKENTPILTEDHLYLKFNELETKKKAPKYFSSLALLRVLYEERKIDFTEYLSFFGYLTSYRFRFLSFNTEDIERAVFGDGVIQTANFNNIRCFNFSLTLSEEYGVHFQKAFIVVGGFLFKILTDNAVIPDIFERLYIEILDSFPSKIDKKNLGEMFKEKLSEALEKKSSKLIITPGSERDIQEKIKILTKATEIFSRENKLWTPNN